MAPNKIMLALSFHESNTCLPAQGIDCCLSIETIHWECCLDVLVIYWHELQNISELSGHKGITVFHWLSQKLSLLAYSILGVSLWVLLVAFTSLSNSQYSKDLLTDWSTEERPLRRHKRDTKYLSKSRKLGSFGCKIKSASVVHQNIHWLKHR